MQTTTQFIQIPEAPAVPGLTFRHFQGESDYPLLLGLINAAKKADQEERSDRLEDIINTYSHLINCDPYQDVLIAEVGEEPVCYSRVSWWDEAANGNRIYQSFGMMAPQWRRKGIGQAMLQHNQRRLREIASRHPSEQNKLFESFCTSFQEGARAMLEKNGYQVVRQFYFMVRPDLANIPELPLPEGIGMRPTAPEHYRPVWEAFQEAFRDHWGYSQPQEEDYQAWVNGPEFQPDLWQIAWEDDQVAGMILNFINHAENIEYARKRGYTEGIAVRRPWRRRGLARALLARSLKMHRDLGMTEAALGVDTDSLSGANILYESMGFQPVKIFNTMRKAMD